MLTPLRGRIVVQSDATETESPGGILIPDSASEQPGPKRGTVVAIPEPPGPCPVAVGDEILYSRFAGTTVGIGDLELLVLKDEDVWAVFA